MNLFRHIIARALDSTDLVTIYQILDWRSKTHEQKRQFLSEQVGKEIHDFQFVQHAITLRQPWGTAVMDFGKDIENRSRRMLRPGWYYLHTSQKITEAEWCGFHAFIRERGIDLTTTKHEKMRPTDYPVGQCIGIVHFSEWVSESSSKWFRGPLGAIISPQRFPIDPIPCKGAQGIFRPSFIA
jgi:hypothetical protein